MEKLATDDSRSIATIRTDLYGSMYGSVLGSQSGQSGAMRLSRQEASTLMASLECVCDSNMRIFLFDR